MDTLSNLRARTNKRVTINHRPFINVRTRVHKHRRHANDAGCNVSAVSDTRTARHNPNTVVRGKLSNRISVLVEELQTSIGWRHVNYCAHAKAEQYALLDPGVSLPSSIRTSLSRADLAAIQ